LAQRLTENTVFFDLSEICDKKSHLPNTMPSLQFFKENMQKLSVSKNANIVMYDDMGIFSAARAAWMMKYFGATNVKILNGGMKKWLAEGKQTA
jgi:thiosulfate/3-mercaptopyruvate sulfurtransferase